jgi:hypothetical protein
MVIYGGTFKGGREVKPPLSQSKSPHPDLKSTALAAAVVTAATRMGATIKI